MALRNIAAVLETKFGSIVTAERPIPKPEAGEILLRNKAIAGNPVEWMVRDYGFGITQYPTVLGSDAAGIVEAVGPDVTKFKVGDRVVGYAAVLYTSNPDHGAWQTYTILKVTNTTALPANISFEEGCIFPMAMATTINAFFVQLGLPRPSSARATISIPGGSNGLLIWGGGGAVAAAMIQLGKALGFTLGATEVFDYRSGYDTVVKNILAAADGAGVKIAHAIDTVVQKDSLVATTTILVKSGGPSSKIVYLNEWPEGVPSPVQKFQTVAYTTFLGHMDLVEWFFNDWFAEALATGVVVPSPQVQVVEGGVASAGKVLDTIKAGVNGVKLVVQV